MRLPRRRLPRPDLHAALRRRRPACVARRIRHRRASRRRRMGGSIRLRPLLMARAARSSRGPTIAARTPVSRVYLQHVGADGALLDAGGVPLDGTPYAQGLPGLLADGVGGAFRRVFDTMTATSTELHVQRVGAAGAPAWGTGVIVASGIAPGLLASDFSRARRRWRRTARAGSSSPGATPASGVARPYVTHLDGAGHLVAPWPAGGLPATSASASATPRRWRPTLRWRVRRLGERPMTGGALSPTARFAPGWLADGRPSAPRVPRRASRPPASRGTSCRTARWPPWASGARIGWSNPPNGDYDRSYAQHVAPEYADGADRVSVRLRGDVASRWRATVCPSRSDRARRAATGGWPALAGRRSIRRLGTGRPPTAGGAARVSPPGS